jgi:NADH-quinone oxidoreductase subunit K
MTLTMSLPVLATILFCIGLTVVIVKKNIIMILIGLELMLNSANLNLIAFSSYRADAQGQLLVLIILIVAVCEAAIGLAIALRIYKFYQTSEPDNVAEIRETL